MEGLGLPDAQTPVCVGIQLCLLALDLVFPAPWLNGLEVSQHQTKHLCRCREPGIQAFSYSGFIQRPKRYRCKEGKKGLSRRQAPRETLYRYLEVSTVLTEARNLSREACTAGVKSAGWWLAKVTSRQWLRSCGDRKQRFSWRVTR